MGERRELSNREKNALKIIEKWDEHARCQAKRFNDMGDATSAREWVVRGATADKILKEIKEDWRID